MKNRDPAFVLRSGNEDRTYRDRREKVRYIALVFSLVFTFFVVSFDINLYFYTSTFIISGLNASQIFIGISVSSFTLGVIIFATVGGALFNRFPAKWILLASLTLATAGSLATGIVSSLPELLALRFIVGMGTGMLQGTAMGYLGMKFPRKRGMLLSLTGVSFAVGLLAGPYSEAMIAPEYFPSYMISGIIGAASILMIILAMPGERPPEGFRGRKGVRGVFNRNTSLVYAGIFFYGIGFFGFIGYFSHFLLSFLHTGQYISALTVAMLGAGGIVFTIPLGYASDRRGRRSVLLGVYGTLAIVSAVIFGLQVTDTVMIVLSFIFGAAYNALIIVIAAAAQDYAPREHIGAASGMVFAFYYAGGIIGGSLFGSILTFLDFRTAGLLAVSTFMAAGFMSTLFILRSAGLQEIQSPQSPERDPSK